MLKRIVRWPYQLLLFLSVVFSIVSVFALRDNNQHMIKLRDEVYAADKAGSGVDDALNNLREYVYSHMNTNLASGGNAIKPPIQLKNTYDRLVEAQQEQVKAQNSKVYTDAQNYCQAQNSTDFSGRNRVPCVTQYVTSHGVSVTPIPAGLYEFDFLSPAWSPDLAGFSLAAAALFLVLFIVSFAVSRRK